MTRQLFPLLFALLMLTGCTGTQIVNTLALSPGENKYDVSYGELERQKLDIYAPAIVTNDTPVLLYFHGGGWNFGSKADYKFFGTAFAARGVETVVANYRLYPEAIYPAFVEDAAKAIAFTKATIAKDRPLIIMGHSAGAHLSALALVDPKYLDTEETDSCKVAAGYIGVAGPYDFEFTEDLYKQIFPVTPRTDAKPVTHAGDQNLPPFLLLHGTGDDTVPLFRSEQMRDALRKAGNPVTMKTYEGVGHINILGAVAPLIRGSAPTFEDSIDFILNGAKQLNTRCK